MNTHGVAIRVICGDVLRYRADVLTLKFAQDLYGVDDAVVGLLLKRGKDIQAKLPKVGNTLLIDSAGAVAAAKILFLGVQPLGRFEYAEIRQFGRDVLFALTSVKPSPEHLAITLHGRGFGLDESEAFKAEVAGLLDALNAGSYPRNLKTISVVERDEQTAARLTLLLSMILPSGDFGFESVARPTNASAIARQALSDVGLDSKAKPHVFVAMPFAKEFADRFHYGIKGAVNAAGYLCERADLATFTGDVLSWVRDRIDNAALVIADLSTANPNVYLEVGYAWGRDVPTVLVVSSTSELRFDVRGQRCLVFDSIQELEELLTSELRGLQNGENTPGGPTLV